MSRGAAEAVVVNQFAEQTRGNRRRCDGGVTAICGGGAEALHRALRQRRQWPRQQRQPLIITMMISVIIATAAAALRRRQRGRCGRTSSWLPAAEAAAESGLQLLQRLLRHSTRCLVPTP